MKRKRTTDPVPPAAEFIDAAPAEVPVIEDTDVTLASSTPRVAPKSAKCSVCGEGCSPNTVDDLCWVCRRLKLSAWRDNDVQMPAQE